VKKLTLILLVFCAFTIKAQPNLILNGSFEINTETQCYSAMFPVDWNPTVNYITSYGSNAAIINDSCITCQYFPNFYMGGGAQEGHWLNAVHSTPYFTPTGTIWGRSMLSFHLSDTLHSSTNYKLSFYIKKPLEYPTDTTQCYNIDNNSIKIGISNNATNLGTVIYNSPLGGVDWTQYSVVFNTINMERYITLEVDTGDTNNYVVYTDNFVLEETSEPATVFVTATNEMPQQEKKLVKIVDILGKESSSNATGLLFYIYSDGSVEKKLIIE